MKDYIKPTFALAGLVPVALAGTTCGISESAIQDIFANDFGWVYNDKALAMNESCEDPYKYDVETYCKFTSVEAGALKVIGS